MAEYCPFREVAASQSKMTCDLDLTQSAVVCGVSGIRFRLKEIGYWAPTASGPTSEIGVGSGLSGFKRICSLYRPSYGISAVSGTVLSMAKDDGHNFSKNIVPEIEIIAGLGIVGDAHLGENVSTDRA